MLCILDFSLLLQLLIISADMYQLSSWMFFIYWSKDKCQLLLTNPSYALHHDKHAANKV